LSLLGETRLGLATPQACRDLTIAVTMRLDFAARRGENLRMASNLFAKKPLAVSRRVPERVVQTGPGRWFADFGKAVFGAAELRPPASSKADRLEICLGEQLAGPMRIERAPIGNIRFQATKLGPPSAKGWRRSLIQPDKRNTGPRAIGMPTRIGEVLPFRYCEIENADFPVTAANLRQTFVHYPFDDDASAFRSSDPVLNDVWDLCKRTIKATTFCGLYVDGDRERIPYEGDAYINQLSHYCVDSEYGMARRTLEFLLERATWPTDWHLHCVLIAWYDYLYTGDDASLRRNYETLKLKTLDFLARGDGLISPKTRPLDPDLKARLGLDDFFKGENLSDLVDWPRRGFRGYDIQGEDDSYELTDCNTAVNALRCRALELMERIAAALGRTGDVGEYRRRARRAKRSLNEKMLNAKTGLYVDGVGSRHSSLHANFFPLLAGCVAKRRLPKILRFIRSRGMACGVYGAQHLLDALYKAGDAQHALDLMTSTGKRSWANMIYTARSTMALEAWDPVFKPNLDFNHAWGAAPANLIARRLMGVRPAEPGFGKCVIAPQPGNLRWAQARVPTPLGPIEVEFWNEPGRPLQLAYAAPEGMAVEARPQS